MKLNLNKKIKVITDKLDYYFNKQCRLNYRNQGIINFIDIGSVGGLPEPWRRHANKIKFLLNFEPNELPRRGRNYMTYNTAVWENDETRNFFIYKGFNATGSSLFKQNYEYVSDNFENLKDRGPQHLSETWFERSQLVDTIEIKCRKLDNILRDEFPSMPFHFVKIDAQGAEYNILKGSDFLLSNSCLGLHLELFTIPLYEGIVLMDEVEAYLASYNFRMVKKYPAHGTFDSQHDCLFIKDNADPVILSIIHEVYGIKEKA